jgi:hypothetical protein
MLRGLVTVNQGIDPSNVYPYAYQVHACAEFAIFLLYMFSVINDAFMNFALVFWNRLTVCGLFI